MPYLTIGDKGSNKDLRAVERAGLSQLPIPMEVTYVQIICGTTFPCSWQTIGELLFARPSAASVGRGTSGLSCLSKPEQTASARNEQASRGVGRRRSGQGENFMQATQLDQEIEARLRAADLTYDHVGRTSGELPSGYHHLKRQKVIGHGAARFSDAALAVLSWQIQLRSGIRVSSSSPTVLPGTVAMLGIGAGPLRLRAPCRVVYIIDEPNRQGFAYGTLPGHPESGEEAFVVERADDDSVSLNITCFARPVLSLARVAGPFGRFAQSRVTDRYFRSLAESTEHHR